MMNNILIHFFFLALLGNHYDGKSSGLKFNKRCFTTACNQENRKWKWTYLEGGYGVL